MMILINPSDFDPRRAVPVTSLLAAYRFLTGPSARAFICRADPHRNSRGEMVPGNGLAGAIRRIGGKGGKVLIDPVLFGDWLRAQPHPDPPLTTSQSHARTGDPLKRAAATIETDAALRAVNKNTGKNRPRRDDVALLAELDLEDGTHEGAAGRRRQPQREATASI
jgi:hypothetical protein